VIAKFRADAGRDPLPAEVIETLKIRAGLITDDKDWAAYLRGLPDYKEAAKLRVHSPLIAFIHWELQRPEAFARVEHVIVDEAQDVTPLEWLLLDEINEGDKWTLIGDLNQRRSDHTLPDWNQVLDHIAIEPDTAVRRMQRGYRSTKPILDFANRLLPRTERKINAFQQVGPEPRITSVKTGKEIGDAVAREVDRLLAEYPQGTIAVICQTATAATSGLRKRGWSSGTVSPDTWSREGRDVKVLIHDAARGLEFDAVVVVEPSQFPKNFGRFGPLYTALTRANRELAVVHAEKLPRELLKR
jgi:DNA helicase IV